MCQPFPGAVIDFEGDTTLTHLLIQAPQHDVHDLFDVVHSQRVEHDGFVDTIEKLRVEGLFEFGHDALFHLRERHLLGVLLEPNRGVLFNRSGAEVRGHDQDHVLEVDLAPIAIGEMSVVHHL